jgi:hypothetical protein
VSFGLFLADAGELHLRRRLGEEIVHAGLRGDCGSGQGIVARNHDRADTHAPQLGKTLLDTALHHILELNHTEHVTILRHHQRGAAFAGDFLHRDGDGRRILAALRFHPLAHTFRRAFANLGGRATSRGGKIDPAHARLRGKRDEGHLRLRQLAFP